VLLLLLLVALVGGDEDARGARPQAAAGSGETRDEDERVARLIAQAGQGATLDERGQAFDRLVALGYYDRVPWVEKLSLDLEQHPSCEKRRDVVVQLKNLRDPAAIPALQKARDRKGNECLKGLASQTIASLGTKADPVPQTEAAEDTQEAPAPPRRRQSSGGGGGHF
jgi:hypothetical protein